MYIYIYHEFLITRVLSWKFNKFKKFIICLTGFCVANNGLDVPPASSLEDLSMVDTEMPFGSDNDFERSSGGACGSDPLTSGNADFPGDDGEWGSFG